MSARAAAPAADQGENTLPPGHLACFLRARERVAPASTGLNLFYEQVQALMPTLLGSTSPVDTACTALPVTGSALDDLEDVDQVGPLGAWRLFDPADITATLTLPQPGAGTSQAAIGATGSASPGLSLEFMPCLDARQASGLALEVLVPNATANMPVTLRLRTRGTDTAARGGNCGGAACGDHFTQTVNAPPGAFSLVGVPMGSFLNSQGMPPDLLQLVGLDVVAFGGATRQIVVDNVQLEGQQQP